MGTELLYCEVGDGSNFNLSLVDYSLRPVPLSFGNDRKAGCD